MENENVVNEIRNRCVRSAAIAGKLLRWGHNIIDIKPDKDNSERSVFVFGADETLNSDVERAKEQRAEEKNGGKRVYIAASIARSLIKKGYKVLDIKPDRDNNHRTVFVFEETENLAQDIEKSVKAIQDRKSEKEICLSA